MRFEERFTERAKQALNLAHEAAADLGHSYVGSEHILLGIIQEGGGVAAQVLRDAGLDRELVSDLIEKHVGHGQRDVTTVQGLTPCAKRIIELAINDAVRLNHNYVGTEHLLMGILREYDSVASKMISSTGLDPNKIYTDIMNLFTSGDYRRPAPAAVERSGKKGDTKTLDQFARDLTESAARGNLDPVIGRDREIQRVVQILSRRWVRRPLQRDSPSG